MVRKYAIVTGGSGGLGLLINEGLRRCNFFVENWDLKNGIDVSENVSLLPGVYNKVDVLVNCAGYNEPNWIDQTSQYDFLNAFSVNALSIFNTYMACEEKINGGTICNIISNAADIPMRASLAYNTSKAAAKMMTRQMARELGPRNGITVFGVSPNWMAGTQMTKDVGEHLKALHGWSQEELEAEQRKSLVGELTPPERVAEFVCWLLEEKERHKYLAGSILEYGV